MSKPDNPPAFPIYGLSCDKDGHLTQVAAYSQGLTLRDWFAGQALAGMIGTANTERSVKAVPTACYMIADAMLRAREGKQ